MSRVLVTYESKYGNTRLVAEAIAEGLREVAGIDIVLQEFKRTDLNQVAGSDVILVGSPNHMGRATRDARKFIDKLGKIDLKGKQAAVFDTYLGKDFEKAVKGMEKQIGEKVPDLKLLAPGLSIRVNGMKGPISEGELTRCREFGSSIASQISRQA